MISKCFYFFDKLLKHFAYYCKGIGEYKYKKIIKKRMIVSTPEEYNYRKQISLLKLFIVLDSSLNFTHLSCRAPASSISTCSISIVSKKVPLKFGVLKLEF